jgi:hypothetical protein
LGGSSPNKSHRQSSRRRNKSVCGHRWCGRQKLNRVVGEQWYSRPSALDDSGRVLFSPPRRLSPSNLRRKTEIMLCFRPRFSSIDPGYTSRALHQTHRSPIPPQPTIAYNRPVEYQISWILTPYHTTRLAPTSSTSSWHWFHGQATTQHLYLDPLAFEKWKRGVIRQFCGQIDSRRSIYSSSLLSGLFHYRHPCYDLLYHFISLLH